MRENIGLVKGIGFADIRLGFMNFTKKLAIFFIEERAGKR
jgi:hypothetical protein